MLMSKQVEINNLTYGGAYRWQFDTPDNAHCQNRLHAVLWGLTIPA